MRLHSCHHGLESASVRRLLLARDALLIDAGDYIAHREAAELLDGRRLDVQPHSLDNRGQRAGVGGRLAALRAVAESTPAVADGVHDAGVRAELVERAHCELNGHDGELCARWRLVRRSSRQRS